MKAVCRMNKGKKGMKPVRIVVAVLAAGMIAACASNTVEEIQQPVDAADLADSNQTPRGASGTLAATSGTQAVAGPTNEAPSAPTSTPTPTHMRAATPTATLTPTALSTATHTPTAAPTVRSDKGLSATATPIPASMAGSGEDAESADLAGYGLEVYRRLYCGICHELTVADTGGLFGPTHNDVALTAELRIQDPEYTGAAATAAEYLRESIVSPTVYLVEGYEHASQPMPAYNSLSETDLNALVQLLLNQR